MAGAILGPRAAVDLVTPTGVDGGRVLAFQLRNRKSAQEVVGEVAARLGAVNEQLVAKYARLIYVTDSLYAYYTAGVAGTAQTPKKVEFKQADPVRGDTSGHMLPLDDFEDAMGWTPIYLRDAHEAQLDADVDTIIARWTNRVEKDILTRMFTNTELALGTGYSVPWAIGTGVNVPYIPQQYGGYSFDSTHTHFVGQTGTINAANTKLALEKMIGELVHHGISGRLIVMASEADRANYAGMTGFVKYIPGAFQVVAGSANAPVYVTEGELSGMPGEVIGFYLSDRGPVVEIRLSERVPTGYAWMGKSYGDRNSMNPIAIRVHPDVGFGLRPDPQLSQSVNPELDKVLFKGTHGIGVNQRLNGVAIQMNSATFAANPSIS